MALTHGQQGPCERSWRQSAETHPCPERDRPWVLAVAILGSSLAFIEGSVVNLALPAIQSAFAVSAIDLQWVINAYLLTLGALMLIGGSAGDRFGLRRVFLWGLGLFALGALMAGVVNGFAALVAARVVQGVGGALMVPASLALISAYFPEDERGRAIGTWAGASALTTALGPLLGGWLVDVGSWRWVFLMIPPVALLTGVLAFWRVPRDQPSQTAPPDWPGALLLAAALTGLSLGMLRFIDGRWSVALTTGVLLAGVITSVLFVRRERRHRHPMLPFDLFGSPVFSGANLMTLLLYAALNGVLFFLPFNLIQIQDYSATAAGAAFLPFTLIMGFGSRYTGGLVNRHAPHRVLAVGAAVVAAGCLWLMLPGVEASFWRHFLPGLLLLGVGMTIAVAPLTTVVMGAVPENRVGVASGINNTAARLAGFAAVAGLTALAVTLFGHLLAQALSAQEIPAAQVQTLLTERARLAELRPPDSMADAGLIRGAIENAFVGAYRGVMLLSALLAALAAGIAWRMIRPATEERMAER